MFSKLSALDLLAVALQASTATACIQALACWAPADGDNMFMNTDLSIDDNAVCGAVLAGSKPGAWGNAVVEKSLIKETESKHPTCNVGWDMTYSVTYDPTEVDKSYVDFFVYVPEGKELRGRTLPSLGTRKIGGIDMLCGAYAWMEGERECQQEWKDGMGFIEDFDAYYAGGGDDKVTVVETVLATVVVSQKRGPTVATRTMWVGGGYRNQ